MNIKIESKSDKKGRLTFINNKIDYSGIKSKLNIPKSNNK